MLPILSITSIMFPLFNETAIPLNSRIPYSTGVT